MTCEGAKKVKCESLLKPSVQLKQLVEKESSYKQQEEFWNYVDWIILNGSAYKSNAHIFVLINDEAITLMPNIL